MSGSWLDTLTVRRAVREAVRTAHRAPTHDHDDIAQVILIRLLSRGWCYRIGRGASPATWVRMVAAQAIHNHRRDCLRECRRPPGGRHLYIEADDPIASDRRLEVTA